MRKLIMTFLIPAAFASLSAGQADSEIDALLPDYFQIQASLAKDTTTGVDEAARKIHLKASAAVESSNTEVKELLEELSEAAKRIQGQDLEAARGTFFLLSKPLLVYLNKFHAEKGQYSRFYCSMVNKAWVQPDSEVRNPYHGSSMLRCGELIK